MSKDVMMLGMRDEVVSIDLLFADEITIEVIMEWIHGIVYQELLSRELNQLTVWSIRAENVFKKNRLICIADLINIPKIKVSILDGCGYKTRKEVYDTCKEYGVTLLNWEPGYYYERETNHYVFTDEEVKKSEV